MKKESNKNRGNWANKTEFFLSCLGYAIGLGNVWRFPYLCYKNGGGAFLIPYLLMLFLCGIPLFFMETSLGQFSSTGCITVFNISPIFKGAGYAIAIVNIISITYCTVVIGYALLFVYYCFQFKLPWADCDNPWNSKSCFKLGGLRISNTNINDTFLQNNGQKTTPADEFFHNHILKISPDVDTVGTIVWPIFFSTVISWIVMYLCIMKGVKSVGKVVYFTATFPFLLLFVLFIRGITLPGAWVGITFYIYPQWHQLTNLRIWAEAAAQIFFSLGPGWGGLINMASYNQFKNNNLRDSILVPILNSGSCIFAGFVVFSVIGFMSHETGLPISTVITGGPGLVFVTYPEAITMLPWPNLWAILFFLMVFFIGVDTVFVEIETVVSSIIDEYPQLRSKKTMVTVVLCIIMLLMSLIYTTNGGMYLLHLFEWYGGSIPVIIICLIEVTIVGTTYGVNNFVRDLEFMIQCKIHYWWKLAWKFITPTILILVFITTMMFNTTITYHNVIYPDWSIIVGWCSCGVSIICIPIYMGYRLIYIEKGDFIDRIKSSIRASHEWGPAKKEHRNEWLIISNNYKNATSLQTMNPDKLHEEFVPLSA